MPRTPDRSPGPSVEEELQLDDLGADPTVIGGITNNAGALKGKDSIGVFDLRSGVDFVCIQKPNATLNYTSGFLTSVDYADGRTKVLTYNGTNQLIQVVCDRVEGDQLQKDFIYNPDGTLATVTSLVTSFSPLDIPNLEYWYTIATAHMILSGSDVIQLMDRSGLGRHATVPGGANPPNWNSAASSLDFDPANTEALQAASWGGVQPTAIISDCIVTASGTTQGAAWDSVSGGGSQMLCDSPAAGKIRA